MTDSEQKQTRKQRSWINRTTMAASIGISPQAFIRWGVEPVAKIGREVFFTVAGVIDYKLAKQAESLDELRNLQGSDIDIMLSDQELPIPVRESLLRIQKLQLENRRLALHNEILEGRSLPAWGVTEVLSKILGRAGEIFDGLPLKIKRKHPKLDKRVVELIKTEIIKVQNEVERLDQYIENIIDEVVDEAEERVR